MGEHNENWVYGRVKVAFKRRDGLPVKIEFKRNFDERTMTKEDIAIANLFMTGLHNLCDVCRNAMRELRIVRDVTTLCESLSNGKCERSGNPCDGRCEAVRNAINEYRKEVNENAERVHDGQDLSGLPKAQEA